MEFEKIKGLIDAPFTPFLENGEVNYEPIPAYAAMLKKNGLKGVFINGSSARDICLPTTSASVWPRHGWPPSPMISKL